VEYEADTYQEIGLVEDMGEFGDAYNPVTANTLSDARVRKRKGTADAGDMNMVVLFDAADTGQQALKDALDDTGALPYNIKVVLNDAITPSTGTPTTFFFSAFVMSRRITSITSDNIPRGNITLGIDSPIIEVAAT
jgi:hypothetical protein